MAITSYRSFLMIKNSDYEKLVDIKTVPDLGGEPELLDITTLSDYMKISIPGIQELEGFKFTTNYDKTTFQKLKALEGQEKEYAVWLGGTGDGTNLTPTGEHGKFKFKGKMVAFPSGFGVNEVPEINITIAPSTTIDFE